MYAFYLYKQIKCCEDYTKKDLNQKREKLKHLTQNRLLCIYRFFLILYLFFAQLRILLNGGKYSAKIIIPGMPKTHPWNMGIRPPITPIKTRTTPKAILSECLIIYILAIKLLFKSLL